MSEAKILEHDPLTDAETILRDDFYGKSQAKPATPLTVAPPQGAEATTEVVTSATRKRTKPKVKPTHYKVVCISLYTQDIENLEKTVAELKRRGHTKANKSQLIRQALRQLDIDKLPPPQQ
jgi:hypothetical protein